VSFISGYTIVTNGVRFPWLVEGLKVESVVSPSNQTTYSLGVEDTGILSGSLGRGIVGATYIGKVSTERNAGELWAVPSVGQPVSPFHSSILFPPDTVSMRR
jgi:hypothetical protein